MDIRLFKKNRFINILLSIVFLAFATLQLNDPDPFIWFTIYIIIAIVCLLINFIQINNKLIYVYIMILIIYAGFHFSYILDWLQTNKKGEILGEMVYEKPYLEGSREFIGLAMGICGLLFAAKTNRK